MSRASPLPRSGERSKAVMVGVMGRSGLVNRCIAERLDGVSTHRSAQNRRSAVTAHAAARPEQSKPRGYPSIVVICDHSKDFAFGINLHKFTALSTLLVRVVKNDTGNSPQHVDEVELQVRIHIQSSLEVASESFLAFDHAGRDVKNSCGYRLYQNDILGVVRHYFVE